MLLILEAQCPQSLCQRFRVGLGHSLSCGALMVAPVLHWHCPGAARDVSCAAGGRGAAPAEEGKFCGGRDMLEMGER